MFHQVVDVVSQTNAFPRVGAGVVPHFYLPFDDKDVL